MCIMPKRDSDWFDCEVHYLTGSKKFIGLYANMTGTEMLDWTSSEERFDFISDHFVNLLNEGDEVMLEGYAFGAKGQVFQIGENTGLLKHKMHSKVIAFDVIAPSVLKKFATGKGNADKLLMNEAFEKLTGFSVRKKLDMTPSAWNPSSDVIDAFFLARYRASLEK